MQLVVEDLSLDDERTVLGVAPATVLALAHVEPQLVLAGLCHLTQQVIAQPVVALLVAESHPEVRPRPVEEVRPVQVLLNEQRNAVL